MKAADESGAASTAPAPEANAETPQSLADVFREAVRQTGVEEGIALIPETTKKRGRPAGQAPVEASGPNWTGDGIGRVVAAGHDMVFRAFELPELEPEERREVENTTARFLNAIWPTGAAFEPHAAFVLQEASVIVPRVAAYQMRKKEEADRAAQKKGLSDKSILPINSEAPKSDA